MTWMADDRPPPPPPPLPGATVFDPADPFENRAGPFFRPVRGGGMRVWGGGTWLH